MKDCEGVGKVREGNCQGKVTVCGDNMTIFWESLNKIYEEI